MQTRALGTTDIEITPLGLGTWQFSAGRGIAGRFWPALDADVSRAIVKTSLDGGIRWFDTAEIYGNGASERALADALTAAGRADGDVVVATKWNPVARTAGTIRTTIDERLRCLGGFSIDLHQVHNPASFSTVEAEMDAMADLVDDGKIRAVGVSNFDEKRMRRAHAALQRRGLPLASNQVRYSLLHRGIETRGVLAAAKELGVTIIAYSPLSQGLLTGKFHARPERVRRRMGPRRWLPEFGARRLARSRPLIDELTRVGEAHGATPAQVALNWLVTFHGDVVVAIPGATQVHHAEQNVGALAFELTRDELDRLDRVSRELG